ncbi:MAG: hypothetical protein CME26_09925 [Gemmatimonadetes bacterium]|nr:hypothetical protein [Gemmatimonadota bacterium]
MISVSSPDFASRQAVLSPRGAAFQGRQPAQEVGGLLDATKRPSTGFEEDVGDLRFEFVR